MFNIIITFTFIFDLIMFSSCILSALIIYLLLKRYNTKYLKAYLTFSIALIVWMFFIFAPIYRPEALSRFLISLRIITYSSVIFVIPYIVNKLFNIKYQTLLNTLFLSLTAIHLINGFQIWLIKTPPFYHFLNAIMYFIPIIYLAFTAIKYSERLNLKIEIPQKKLWVNFAILVSILGIMIIGYIALGLTLKNILPIEQFMKLGFKLYLCFIGILTLYICTAFALSYLKLEKQIEIPLKTISKFWGMVLIIFLPGLCYEIFPLHLLNILFNPGTNFKLIPQEFSFASVFVLLWNVAFIQIALPYLFKKNISNETIQNFSKKYHLTEREQDMMSLLINGLSNKKISAQLFITEATVKKHLQNIFEKTSSENRFELIQKINLY